MTVSSYLFNKKELKRIGKELDKLVELALSSTLKKETIRDKEKSLLEAKTTASGELEANQDKLRSMPDIHQVKQEAEHGGFCKDLVAKAD